MGWVNDARRELAAGRTVQVRPTGGSMRGRIESGELVTLAPVEPSDVNVNDVVLVEWRGNFLLHLVKDVGPEGLLICNNLGKVNGWVPLAAVVGRVIEKRGSGEQHASWRRPSFCFGSLAAGWLDLTITDGAGGTWSGAVSAVPSDPILALAEFAGAAVDGLCARVELQLEPDSLVLLLEHDQFCVDLYTSRRPGGTRRLFTIDGPPSDIGVAIWRGLRDLEARSPGDSWPHPFPHERVTELAVLVASHGGQKESPPRR